MKAIKNTNPNIDILEATPVEKGEPPSPLDKSPSLEKKPGLVPLIMPKADK